MTMTCYGVDTTPIGSMSEALENLPIDLTDAEPDTFAAYAQDNRESLGRLVEMYLDACPAFLQSCEQ